ncbi:glycoside hydrolase family 6 protein [Modestobacter versicolor]|uniref:Glucanase n=1 Tax=Modestobacter versicolor TaxID=429133 RepID=A0A323VBV2_9ACTN|nr:glycoside hydrolase family 6 protein [Modestobacter versicolor]MBB3676906.1 endoglucanase [Modestobacter versicolor]PZA20676.1 glycoside hydrolase [Modestobacter versicolor]
MFSTPRRGRAALLAVTAALTLGQLTLSSPAAAAPPTTQAPPLAPGTRFTTPVPDSGAVQQAVDLTRAHRFGDAGLIAREVATPQASWFTDGTPAEVRQEVRRASALAAATRSVPTFVVYNVPGRDCSQYSAGGAADDAAYRAWVDGFAAGLTRGQQVVVVVEPDGLALMPGDCPAGTYPEGTAPTDEGRLADIAHAGRAIERANPNALVYLDAGHTAWHNVGSIADRLQDAAVAEFQGLALNTSNYQYTPNLSHYGTWISACLAVLPATYVHGVDADPCPNQYWNGGPANGFTGVALDPFQQWSDTATDPAANTLGITQRYEALLAGAEPTAHVVIDTSRNGRGPWAPAPGAAYPDPQTWCNPPGRGLGARPKAVPDPAFPLVDAYLWVKTPGQSDGECNRGVPGSTTDPEWGGITDPAAGAWFPQQALQLAQLAVPPLR